METLATGTATRRECGLGVANPVRSQNFCEVNPRAEFISCWEQWRNKSANDSRLNFGCVISEANLELSWKCLKMMTKNK